MFVKLKKNENEFTKDYRNKDGLKYLCKKCFIQKDEIIV